MPQRKGKLEERRAWFFFLFFVLFPYLFYLACCLALRISVVRLNLQLCEEYFIEILHYFPVSLGL